MTYSDLTDDVLATDKSSSRNGEKIVRIIAHHWATTSMAGRDRLVYSDDKASANYLIYDDGTLIGSVPEERRAWTSGSGAADRPSITVEIQNHTAGPDWKISNAAVDTLTALAADIADRYGWETVNLRGHRDFANTACPGPYLYPRLPDIAAKANALMGGDTGPTLLDVDGVWGPKVTRSEQRRLDAPYVDGEISRQNAYWRDDNPGLGAGWEWMHSGYGSGSQTIELDQRDLKAAGHYNGNIDGLAGVEYFKAKQRDLKAAGWYDGNIDGEIWRPSSTVKAMQRKENKRRKEAAK